MGAAFAFTPLDPLVTEVAAEAEVEAVTGAEAETGAGRGADLSSLPARHLGDTALPRLRRPLPPGLSLNEPVSSLTAAAARQFLLTRDVALPLTGQRTSILAGLPETARKLRPAGAVLASFRAAPRRADPSAE